MNIEILNWGVSVASSVKSSTHNKEFNNTGNTNRTSNTRKIICDKTGNSTEAQVIDRETLAYGDKIIGPALIVEHQTTTLVGTDFIASIDPQLNILMERH